MQPRGQFETSVDAGRNETALKRAEPGRVRVRSLAARACRRAPRGVRRSALPLQAQAQTTYVSNIGQSENACLGDY